MTTYKTYSTFAELRNNELDLGDLVIFDYRFAGLDRHDGFHVEYRVGSRCLIEINREYDKENEIFKLLGLDPWDFCEQHYLSGEGLRHTKLPDYWERYKTAYPNLWPPYCVDDYESITKVVLELFRLIEEPERLKETSEILFID